MLPSRINIYPKLQFSNDGVHIYCPLFPPFVLFSNFGGASNVLSHGEIERHQRIFNVTTKQNPK